MTHEDCLAVAQAELRSARRLLTEELRAYPTPVSGCDAQYNHLIGMRASITDALDALAAPRFVATPRTPTPSAGVESR